MNHQDTEPRSQFIVYACPTGALAADLEKYFVDSQALYGKNAAHQYMPHCTLTGFFADDLQSIPIYLQALDRAYLNAKNTNLPLDIEIIQLTFSENWHGLELQADGIKQLITKFTQLENSPTRQEAIRTKDWLHLSLAYEFEENYAEQLQNLAREIIDLTASVNWELRFYQKGADWSWKCWQTWLIF